jgi:hypothetical protein
MTMRKVFERPAHWRHYAVSYGNGNDGLSRLWPDFTLWCDPGAIGDVARVAMITRGFASPRWVKANVEIGEEYNDAVQACLLNPPRSPDWCEANGAWKLCEVYLADEADDRSEAPEFVNPVAAFGKIAKGI